MMNCVILDLMNRDIYKLNRAFGFLVNLRRRELNMSISDVLSEMPIWLTVREFDQLERGIFSFLHGQMYQVTPLVVHLANVLKFPILTTFIQPTNKQLEEIYKFCDKMETLPLTEEQKSAMIEFRKELV